MGVPQRPGWVAGCPICQKKKNLLEAVPRAGAHSPGVADDSPGEGVQSCRRGEARNPREAARSPREAARSPWEAAHSPREAARSPQEAEGMHYGATVFDALTSNDQPAWMQGNAKVSTCSER